MPSTSLNFNRINFVWIGANNRYIDVNPQEKLCIKFQIMILKNGIYDINENLDEKQDETLFQVYLKHNANNTYVPFKKLNTRLIVIR
jgi:hypothetical protein